MSYDFSFATDPSLRSGMRLDFDPFLVTTVRAALEAARSVRVLGAVTPRNAAAERARLLERHRAGDERAPEWRYEPHVPHAGTLERLEGLARAAGTMGGELADVLASRLEELLLEARLAACAGKRELASLAEARFPAPSDASTVLAREWMRPVAEPESDAISADDENDARSLVRQVRRLVGRLRLPFSVKTTSHLSSLAAVGERTIYIARGRTTSAHAARRTAIHEVHGHALPRARAATLHPLLSLGTARGADDQEGLALVYEERTELLDGTRKAELAQRHLAASAMRTGASFVEVVRALRAEGADLERALVAAERVFRGSDGTFAGLGRESVYLASFLRVRDHLRARPEAEMVLGSGQVAVGCSAVAAMLRLGQFAGRHALPWPPPTSATG